MAKQPYLGNKKKNFSRYSGNQRQRVNHRIRVPKIRVIGPDGAQLGVLDTQEALKMAKAAGLDLVEVSPTSRPPVCRILDYGKYKYEEAKKAKGSKTKNVSRLKEVKFRVNIDTGDYETKLRRAEKFLFKGHKLKITLMLRGREMGQKERAFEVVKRAIADLELVATKDMDPKLVGRNITMTMSPLPENKRKLKFNQGAEDFDDIEDDEHEENDHNEESEE